MPKPETWNDMPLCECPHCGHEWQADDWYHLDVDDIVQCPKCELDIQVTCRETTLLLQFQPRQQQPPSCWYCHKPVDGVRSDCASAAHFECHKKAGFPKLG
jgi:hypothetical protein